MKKLRPFRFLLGLREFLKLPSRIQNPSCLGSAPKVRPKIQNRIRTRFRLGFAGGLCLAVLSACAVSMNPNLSQVNTTEAAERVVREQLMPNINVDKVEIPEAVAQRYAVGKVPEPLPKVEDFPLYGAQPPTNSNTVYLEIFSSSEKANGKKQEERWLVDVAEAFNAKQFTLSSGQVIQVGVRNVPSGIAVRLLRAKAAQPAGYSPSNMLLLQMLQQQGLQFNLVSPHLIRNTAGFVVQDKVYRELAANGIVTFERLLDAILSGKLRIGYTNPYISSTSLNLIYTLFWRSAGHQQDGKVLTVGDLQSAQVNSAFTAFQKQVLVTTPTTLELQEIFIRDRQKLESILLEYQNYQVLKKLPGFETLAFVPFGIPHDNPLVGFGWNTPAQQEALKRFSEFATSAPMQKQANDLGFVLTDYLKQGRVPPTPSGEVLRAAQSYWKERKDGGRTVYLMTVIDTSGSMEGDRIKAVQTSLRIAAQQINAGNYFGLMTFSDRPKSILPLAPFDTLQHKRLLAAIDDLRADGSTAMYDGAIAGLAQLMERRQADPNGRFYLLLLSDGEVTDGLKFAQVKDVLAHSGVRIYPIAYGEVNQGEMKAIAALREATVKSGTPQNLQTLLKDLFQTNL